MFRKKEFDVFKVEGLDERMAAVRERIQPVFQELDEYFVKKLTPLVGEELIVHIAQHRRRTANAPDFTWSAMGGDKRGYKKYPHFTLGINENYIVMWLSFIDNPQNEKQMAQAFLETIELLEKLPGDFVINTDHTINNYINIKETDLVKDLTRWRDVKKGEFQVGRIITKEDVLLKTPTKARTYMLETYVELLDLYKLAYQARV
ncbi:DUF1054 family protein [uncultured Vagococcus sp.]|uniref:DUF1054 family protein n=1 Tax=uncultured Vagococcus sp. TaxID=189676 RepID=UPI0028CFE06A|nr:DUF1054 family protein [uncultured Vagococcus sp.]